MRWQGADRADRCQNRSNNLSSLSSALVRPLHDCMDHAQPAHQPVRPASDSGFDRVTSPALPLAAMGDAEPSGEPDSPGPRSPRSGNGVDDAADLFFDQPFGAVAGFLLGLITLLVPLAGVVMDRPLLPDHQESSERGFRPVAVAESPGSRGPGKTAPDR